MDGKKAGAEKTEQTEIVPKYDSHSEKDFDDELEKSNRNPTRSGEQNLTTLESHLLSHGRSKETSSQPLVHSSKSPIQDPEEINKFTKTPSSTDNVLVSSQELQNRTKCSQSIDGLALLRKKPISSPSALFHSGDSGININEGSRSSLGEKCDAHFAISPEHASVQMNRSPANIMTESGTPSPDKRSVEGPTPTHTKRMKKTPESDTGQSDIKQDSCRLNLRTSADDETIDISLTNVQAQKMADSNEEGRASTFLTTPLLSSKRKRKVIKSSFIETKTTNDSSDSNSQSPSSDANAVLKSVSCVQTEENKTAIGVFKKSKSKTEEKTIMPHHPADLYSTVKQSCSDNLHLTRSFSETKDEFPLNLTASRFASSTSPNLDSRKQKDVLSVSDILIKGVLPNLPPEEPGTVLHQTTKTDGCLINPNKKAAKTTEMKPISDVLLEVTQHNFPEQAGLSIVPSPTNGTDISNPLQKLKPRKSTFDNDKSSIRINKSRDISSAYATDSHSASNKLGGLDNKAKSNQNRSCYSTGTSLSNLDLNYDSKKSPTPRSKRTLQRSLSNENLTSTNVSEVRKRCNQFHSFVTSRSSELSTPESNRKVTSDLKRSTCVVQPQSRKILQRSDSNTTSPNRNPFNTLFGGFMGRIGNISNDLLLPRNDPELQMLRSQNDSSQQRRTRHISYDTSASRNPLPPRDDLNPPYINIFEGQASTSRHQPVVADNSSSIHTESLTSRNQPTSSDVNSSIPQESPSVSQYHSSNTSNLPLATDDHNTSSSYYDTSSVDSVDDRESVPFAPSRFDFLPPYASEAHLLLQLVLREMMLYNHEHDQWREFAALFLRYSKSSSRRNKNKLILELFLYKLQKESEHHEVDLRLFVRHFSIRPFLMNIFGRLIWTVIDTLHLLLDESSLKFETVMHFYNDLKSIQMTYSNFWQNMSIEDIEEETSRNKLKNLKKMIERLLLTTLTAFHLLFIHFGENAEEGIIQTYAESLSEEDKIYFGRN